MNAPAALGALLAVVVLLSVCALLVMLGVYAVRQSEAHERMRQDTRERTARVSAALDKIRGVPLDVSEVAPIRHGKRRPRRGAY